MSELHAMPSNPPTSAGWEFNYSVWTPGTVATFCNVNWNSDYRDVPIFDDGQEGLNAFIDSQESTSVTFRDMSYARPGSAIRVPMPLGRMMKFNYVRVFNPAQPIGGDEPRYWYYFITDVRHVAPNTTEIHVQLDVMQSWVYEVQFGRCYVEAGHIGIANENQLEERGRKYLTVPEGFDLGSEYQIDEVGRVVDGYADVEVVNDVGVWQYQIIALSTVDLSESGGDTLNPELNTATGSISQNLPNGASLYVFNGMTALTNWLIEHKKKPWVTQGIVGLWAFPKAYEIPTDAASVWSSGTDTLKRVSGGRATYLERTPEGLEDWRSESWAIRNPRYRHLKKFLTYPYSFFELTTYTGTPIIIKPESWQTDDCEVVSIPHWTPPGMRVTHYPKNYNTGVSKSETFRNRDVSGEFLDLAAVHADMPSFSIVNDSYAGFLAANRHGIAFQHSSADWAQQRAMAGNEVAFGQASMGMELQRNQANFNIANANAQNTVTNNAQIQSTAIGAAGNVIGGAVAGGRAGPGGAVLGAGAGLLGSATNIAQTAVDINARNQSLAISNNAIKGHMSMNVAAAGYMRDTNKQFSDYAAQGDYRNAIAAINAKVQDARMIQPTTSGQLGGDANLLANYKWGFDLKFKALTDSAMTMIGEHWLRYGYAVNRYFSPGFADVGLHCMSRFTYWKMLECTIVYAPMPETFKQAIRGIMEKGVTVWRNPIEIGSIDPAMNEPVGGFAL